MNTIKSSLKNINFKLYISLLFLGLCPTIYSTLRIFFLGQMPDEWAYSIAGQLSWVNLLYEILNEAIILPLFFFVGQVISDKKELLNRIKSGLLISFSIYFLFSLVMIFSAEPLLRFMAADKNIIADSVTYIRIESIANIFVILSSFMLVALVSVGKEKYMYILTAARLIMSVITDTFLISSLPCSVGSGVNGIGYSNIIVNALLFIVSAVMLKKEDLNIFSSSELDFSWIKNFLKIGGISGLESFVRNIAYMLMIVRMVNVVSEQGVYWVANGFIWGWLLLPVLQLGELIKKEISADRNNIKKNTPGYFFLTTVICAVWIVGIPAWKPFMQNILGYPDVEKLFTLVLILIGFYILFAYQNIFDATFYALGKTNYMLFESICTNSVYYGIAFILYKNGIWQPTLNGIALLFGCGMAFDSAVSLGAYIYLLRTNKKTEK